MRRGDALTRANMNSNGLCASVRFAIDRRINWVGIITCFPFVFYIFWNFLKLFNCSNLSRTHRSPIPFHSTMLLVLVAHFRLATQKEVQTRPTTTSGHPVTNQQKSNRQAVNSEQPQQFSRFIRNRSIQTTYF